MLSLIYMRSARIVIGIFLLAPFLVFAQKFSASEQAICSRIGGRIENILPKTNANQQIVSICVCPKGIRLTQADLQKEGVSCETPSALPSPRITPPNAQVKPGSVKESGYIFNDNFVVYADTQELAEEILKRAEEYRERMARALFGMPLPCGKGPCIIHARISPNEYVGWTWPKDDPKRIFHSITMRGPKAEIQGSILRHELTHAILATQFPCLKNRAESALPSWADEGVATTQDTSQHDIARKAFRMSWIKSGKWPDLKKEMIFKENGGTLANDPQDRAQFYALANSFTEFLVSMNGKDTQTFFLFAQAIRDASTAAELDKASRQHYGKTFDQLEKEWRAWVIEQNTNPKK